MADLNKNELTIEMVMKAKECKTPEELVELAKTGGIDITKDEAEAYLAELADFEFEDDALTNVAGGLRACYMIDGCAFKCGTLKDC